MKILKWNFIDSEELGRIIVTVKTAEFQMKTNPCCPFLFFPLFFTLVFFYSVSHFVKLEEDY